MQQGRPGTFYIRQAIKTAKAQETSRKLYMQNDTHWNDLGIKYSYEALYKKLQEFKNLPLQKTQISLREEITTHGDLADMSGRHKKYLNHIASIKNKSFILHDKNIVKTANKIIENEYNNIQDLQKTRAYKNRNLKQNFKTYIQHDSFFGGSGMEPFLANSLGNSLFVVNFLKNNMACKSHKKVIEFYKPNLVIHQMVEVKFNENCLL